MSLKLFVDDYGYLTYDAPFSTEEWLDFLYDIEEKHSSWLDYLKVFYQEPLHTASCKRVSELLETDSRSVNAVVLNMGKMMCDIHDDLKVLDDSGERVFWTITMIGKKNEETSLFDYTLRPELAEALEEYWNQNNNVKKAIIANITWNSNGWKGVTDDKSGHRWVKVDGNIAHESWNFDIDNPRNPEQEVYGYAKFTNNPKYKQSQSFFIVFYSQNKIVGFYGDAKILDKSIYIGESESYNMIARKDLVLLLDNPIDVSDKRLLFGKKRIGQCGFNNVSLEQVKEILNEALITNPSQEQQINELIQSLYTSDTIMKHWHIQMLKPYGNDSDVRTDARQMLKESEPVIGTGEWDDDKHQCQNFKSVPVGTIVMVREGQTAIALCQFLDDNFSDEGLSAKYHHCNFRHVKILQWAESFHQPKGQLFSQGTFVSCNERTDQFKYIQEWIDSISKTDELYRLKKLLLDKKNIILQGAPGTGKTYNTAALALSIIGVKDLDWSNHKDVMEKYRELLYSEENKNGQIGFCTFHQSMDYEDFVEGLKPYLNEENNDVAYRIEPGIFKILCDKARVDDSDNFEEAWNKLFGQLDDDSKWSVPLLSGRGSFDIELNEYDTGLAVRTYEDGSDVWIKGKSKFFTRGQLYMVYKGELGVPSGAHDSYRRAIIQEMKKSFGLRDFTAVASNKNYVLIVDEINRGNVSKIFGELISCLENDKRTDGNHRLDVLLPYSKKLFSVPGNLYIIGTMNTTDRSTGSIDYAIRRRFAFVTMRSDRSLVESLASPLALNLFDAVRKFIVPVDPTIDMEDLMVGHSYFFGDEANLPDRWKYEIYPLLVEYYKDGLIKHPPFAKGEDYCENMQAFIDKYNV